MNTFDKYFETFDILEKKIFVKVIIEKILNDYLSYTSQYCIIKALKKRGYTPCQAIDKFRIVGEEELKKSLGEKKFLQIKGEGKRFYGGSVKRQFFIQDKITKLTLLCGGNNVKSFYKHFFKECSECSERFRAREINMQTKKHIDKNGEISRVIIDINENILCNPCLKKNKEKIKTKKKRTENSKEINKERLTICEVNKRDYKGKYRYCWDCNKDLGKFTFYTKCLPCNITYRILGDVATCPNSPCEKKNKIKYLKCQSCYEGCKTSMRLYINN